MTMNDNAPTATPSAPPACTPACFTVDEIPLPPPEMRKPPQKSEPTLFDDCREDDPRSRSDGE